MCNKGVADRLGKGATRIDIVSDQPTGERRYSCGQGNNEQRVADSFTREYKRQNAGPIKK